MTNGEVPSGVGQGQETNALFVARKPALQTDKKQTTGMDEFIAGLEQPREGDEALISSIEPGTVSWEQKSALFRAGNKFLKEKTPELIDAIADLDNLPYPINWTLQFVDLTDQRGQDHFVLETIKKHGSREDIAESDPKVEDALWRAIFQDKDAEILLAGLKARKSQLFKRIIEKKLDMTVLNIQNYDAVLRSRSDLDYQPSSILGKPGDVRGYLDYFEESYAIIERAVRLLEERGVAVPDNFIWREFLQEKGYLEK
jgi:hypothetical protein